MAVRSFKKPTLLSAFAFFVTISLSPLSAVALESSEVEAAAQEVHESIDAAYAILNGLPEQTRRDLNADIRLLTHAIVRSVERLEGQSPSVIDDAVSHDLHFLADIVHAISYELRTLDFSTSTDVIEDISGRLDELSTAASTHIDQIDGAVDQWIERKSEFLVKFEKQDGMTVVSYLSRLSLDVVRYIGISLLLIGVLVVATLIKIEKSNRPIGEFFVQDSHFSSKLLFAFFFLACATLAVLPGMLVGLSVDAEVLAQEDPCQSLQTQNNQLGLAEQTDSAKLVELTKQRMEVAAADCLGVAEATATVERLAAKAANSADVAHSSPPAREAEAITSVVAVPRVTRIVSEAKVPEIQSVAFLLGHLGLGFSEKLDPIAFAKEPPKQRPAPKLQSPAIAVTPPKAKKPAPKELQKEDVRAAISKEGSSRNKGGDQNGDIKPELDDRNVKIRPATTANVQESGAEVELYLHFKSRDDRGFVEELGDRLKEKGYNVAGIQHVENAMTPGDIRYRHQGQKEEVENIRSTVEGYLNENSSLEKISLHPVYIGKIYPDLPRNRIELWIPQLRNS